MDRKTLKCLLFIVVFVVTGFSKDKDLSLQLLPERVNGWELSKNIEKYRGDDLFLFINGGAEIYHEYGFREVTSGVYKKTGYKPVNAEIYEMENHSSAYGIYTFKAGPGKNVNIGNDSSLEGYYLNFWKGNYLVTLTGFDEDKETTDIIISIAGKIAERIKEGGARPSITKLLNVKGINELKYLEGNLGLFNIYNFSTDDIFKVKKCVTAVYKERRFFVFGYPNIEEGENIYKQATLYLSESSQHSVITKPEKSMIIKDKKGNYLNIYSAGKYIIVFIGDSVADGVEIIKDIKKAFIK
ncbi:MAG: DUF6599 family protein [Acidobacteriota bacterium]